MKRYIRNGLIGIGLILVPSFVWSQVTTVSPVRTITCAGGEFISALAGTGIFTCSPASGVGGINELTGDVTAGPGVGSQAATLANSGVGAGTYTKITVDAKGRATVGASAACADLSDDGVGCTAGAASTSTAGIAKLHNVALTVGWIATINPNGATIAILNQDSTISSIIGNVEIGVGATATLTVYKSPSGTACGSGTALHSGTFNANGTGFTNQTLTLTTTTASAGDRICVQTTDSANWVAGAGVGSVSVHLAPTP